MAYGIPTFSTRDFVIETENCQIRNKEKIKEQLDAARFMPLLE